MGFDTKPNLNDNKFEQFSGETLSLSGCTGIYGDFTVQEEGVFILTSGASSGSVLTSDADGIASWSTLSTPITGATNGITASGQDVILGGSLTGATTISAGSNPFTLSGANETYIQIADGGFAQAIEIKAGSGTTAGIGIIGSGLGFSSIETCSGADGNATQSRINQCAATDGNAELDLRVADSGATCQGLKLCSTADAVFTDQVSCKGFVYSTDYSTAGEVDPRWIPDAAWVTGNTGQGTITGGANGICASGTNLVLGGPLTGDTSITGTTRHNFSIGFLTGNTGQTITFKQANPAFPDPFKGYSTCFEVRDGDGGASFEQQSLFGTASQKMISTGGTSYSCINVSHEHIALRQSCEGLYRALCISNNCMVIVDQVDCKGLLYAVDYSTVGELNPRWIPDAAWVTGQTPSVSASGENVTKEITQASHGFAVKDFVGWSGGTYNKAIADGTYDGEFVGLVTASADTDTFCVTQSGYITGLTGLVTNTTYWLSPDTAGLISDTEPSTDGEVSKAVLVANSTTSAWVLPYAGFMVASGATALSTADNGLTDNSGIVELGGTLCQDTDIDVAGFNLSISGLSGKTTQEKAIFVDDVTGTLVTGATTQTYEGQSPSAIEVGGIPIGTNISGCTFTQLWEDLLVPELYQTSVGTPSTSVGATLTGLREIGCSFSQTITPSYSAGAITPLYCTDNGTTRGGAANDYSYTGSGVSTGFFGCTSCVINPYVVTISTNLWTVCTRYDEGACVKGSKGTVNPTYPTVCAQDSCTSTGSVSVIGAYPLWATCDDITVPLEKFSPLCNMATANNICLVLVDETASDKQKFEIPCAWLGSPTSRPLTGVCLWNSVGGSWEYQGGSAGNSLTYWTCSSATETVQSNSIGYCQFTYNGPQRGTVCIRLVF